MAAFYVVEHLNVNEHIATSIFSRAIDFSLDPFPLKKLKKKCWVHGALMKKGRAGNSTFGWPVHFAGAARVLDFNADI